MHSSGLNVYEVTEADNRTYQIVFKDAYSVHAKVLGIQCEKYKTGTNKFTNVTNY
jgi:hypothetical protein